jgi:hypothetical protein
MRECTQLTTETPVAKLSDIVLSDIVLEMNKMAEDILSKTHSITRQLFGVGESNEPCETTGKQPTCVVDVLWRTRKTLSELAMLLAQIDERL